MAFPSSFYSFVHFPVKYVRKSFPVRSKRFRDGRMHCIHDPHHHLQSPPLGRLAGTCVGEQCRAAGKLPGEPHGFPRGVGGVRSSVLLSVGGLLAFPMLTGAHRPLSLTLCVGPPPVAGISRVEVDYPPPGQTFVHIFKVVF